MSEAAIIATKIPVNQTKNRWIQQKPVNPAGPGQSIIKINIETMTHQVLEGRNKLDSWKSGCQIRNTHKNGIA
jgi:hypothetical protein